MQIVIATLWFSIAQAQSQETINDRTTYQILDLYRRIADIESKDIPTRLRLLEDNMEKYREDAAEGKLLMRSVALAVIGQLVIAGMSYRRRRASDDT